MINYNNKRLLITGGTGSFGITMLKHALEMGFGSIRVLSRDELKQNDLRLSIKSSNVEFFLGDVRDNDSVFTATKDVDYIFNTANNSLDPTATGREKLLNFPYPAGSFLAQRINYELETSNKVKGYAFQVPGKIQSSVGKSKSFFSPQPNQPVNFTADIAIRNNVDSEVVPLASGSLFSGSAGNNFLTCDDFSGDPAEQVEFGDVVTFTDDTGFHNCTVEQIAS